MKEIYINHPDLGENKLVLKLSFWRSPKLYLNNGPIRKEKRQYSLSERLGKPFIVEIKNTPFDPVPKVFINQKSIELVTAFKWYEYLWMGLPVLLIFQGGALGGFLGALAFRANGSIFRSERNLFEKYLFTLGLNVVIALSFLALAYIIQSALN